jgi:O-antigen/teichoic acid export membrane protein
MSKTNWIKKGSYSLLANVIFIGFAFLTFMLLVRLYSPKEFGIWVMYLTITSFAEMARIGIVQNGLIKFLTASDSKQEKAKYITAGIYLNLLTTIVSSLLLVLLAKWLEQVFDSPQLAQLLYFYPFYALLFGMVKFLEFLQMANHDFKGILISNFIFGVSLTAIVFGLWLTNLSTPLQYIILFQCLAAFLALIFSFIYAKKYIYLGSLSKQALSELFHFGKFVFGTNFSSMLFNRMDTLMLGIFTSPVMVALYNIPTRINNYLDVPLNSVAQIMYPKISEKYAKEGISSVRYLYERSVGLLLAVSIPLILVTVLFAKQIVWILAGEQYLDATPFVIAFAVMGLMKPYGRIMGLTLDAIGKPKLNFNLLLFSLIINFTLNLLFIPPLGITGAVIGTFSAVWITIIIGQFIVRKYISVNYFHPFIYMMRFYRDGWCRVSGFFKPKKKVSTQKFTLKQNQQPIKN